MEKTIAGVVVLQGERSLLDKLFRAITPMHYSKDFQQARVRQLEKYRADIAPMREARRKQIEEIEKAAKAQDKL